MSSISDSTQPDEAQLLPAYEALPREERSLSPDARRLFWSLNGPLTTSLWVMETRKTPASRKPYFRQITGGDTTSLHPASQSPLTEPKVSSVTHWDNIDPDTAKEIKELTINGEITAAWGALPDFNPEEDEDGPVHLLKCCGTDRPRGKAAKLVIKPDASERTFVTIHDYVSAVHPWLMERREDILGAIGLVWNDEEPLPSDTKLMVDCRNPDNLTITGEEEWIRSVTYVMRTPPPPAPDD
ncbi:hypothetical protein N431DRAFT_551065 [Stipitochalara longipes BDJ]|nr:hypothetical protein N431DRAFT_551065 [Stipitochalara longipes BDJ]